MKNNKNVCSFEVRFTVVVPVDWDEFRVEEWAVNTIDNNTNYQAEDAPKDSHSFSARDLSVVRSK